MATLVYSPSKLTLEPKYGRLSLKKPKVHDEAPDFFKTEHIKTELIKTEHIKKEDSTPQEIDKHDENMHIDTNNDENNIIENKFSPSLGLPNCGNTCYLNSIIQVLRFTPNFMKNVHTVLSSHKQLEMILSYADEGHGNFFYRLHMLYMTMKKQETFLKDKIGIDMSAFLLQNLESFFSSLRSISLSFEEGEQHDAHEFLTTVLSTFKEFCEIIKQNTANYILNSQASNSSDISSLDGSNIYSDEENKNKIRMKRKRKLKKSVKKSSPIQFIDENATDLGFQGTMRHIIKCLECEKKLEMTEVFTNLEISIADDLIVEDTIDLRECLEQKTILGGENKYFCEECCQKNEALSRYDIVLPPSILLLHCSWLKESSNITDVEKDTTKVLIPFFLRTSENSNVFSCKSDEVYMLYAIVVHIGTSTEVGHYVAFVKDATKTPEMAKVLSPYQNYFASNCCATEEILNYKLFTTAVNSWLLFDDDEVSTIYIDETLESFPYFEYLGNTASPCMIFYFKV